jgi:hypothetical protein
MSTNWGSDTFAPTTAVGSFDLESPLTGEAHLGSGVVGLFPLSEDELAPMEVFGSNGWQRWAFDMAAPTVVVVYHEGPSHPRPDADIVIWVGGIPPDTAIDGTDVFVAAH